MSSESQLTAADFAGLTLDDFKTLTAVNLKTFLTLEARILREVRNHLLPKRFLLSV